MATYGQYTIDGSLSADWVANNRIDRALGAAGYALYGAVAGNAFLFALQVDPAVAGTVAAIGTGTTFWLNTDRNTSTGYNVFGIPTGAEYKVEFIAGVPTLQTANGAAVANAVIDYAYSADNRTVEFAVTFAQLGVTAPSANVYVDVNDAVYLPGSYADAALVMSAPTSTAVGGVTVDGSLADWAPSTRLDTPATATPGYELYGQVTGGNYVFGLKSAQAIDSKSTFYLDTDRNSASGWSVFGQGGGVEYVVEIGGDLKPVLYSVTAANVRTLVSSDLVYSYSADHKTLEIALPQALIGSPASGVNVMADVNDLVFLPSAVSAGGYTVRDLSTLPVAAADHRIAIVYSETSAKAYFSETAYAQLIMNAQNQAAMAGVPYDIITEADLKDIATLAKYDTLVFPSFRTVNSADVAAIESTLKDAIAAYHIGIVSAGDFMTTTETGAFASPDPYERMKTILGITREGGTETLPGGSFTNVVLAAESVTNPMMAGYTSDETIRSYTGIVSSYYTAVNGNGTILADQTFAGQTHAAVITTQTGGTNVHFANEGFLADNNLLSKAIDYASTGGGTPAVTLQMTRGTSLFASRTDMDQAQEIFDVSPEGGGPGIYDKLVPILQQWKSLYNFVGSYYVDIGNNQAAGQYTDWTKSLGYYQQILAMGNEIGSHSLTHPEDTNLLTPAQIQAEFLGSLQQLNQRLGAGTVTGVAVPGAPETLATAELIGQYYSYMSGGYSGVGAGYPGAIGFLTPADVAAGKVYIAPNVKFDFSLIDFAGMTAAQAAVEWAAEFAQLTAHATAPVIVWPWHDYGATEWIVNSNGVSNYKTQMFTDFIALAYNAGSEFVTLADLADRVVEFEKSSLTMSTTGNIVTATVVSSDAGRFALNVAQGSTIAKVDNWYAYDSDSIFLPSTGGTFVVTLGTPQDVTHVTALPMRADLKSLSGDGTNLSFTVVGEGSVTIDLAAPAGRTVSVTGAASYTLNGEILTVALGTYGQHTVTVALNAIGYLIVGTAGNDTIDGTHTVGTQRFAGAGNDTIIGLAGDDLLVGLGGNDSIDGGAGFDTMVGGAGNDTYVVNSTSDVVTELANEGTDLVLVAASFTLSANVENLTLTGAGSISGTGNSLANIIVGNTGNNTLDGGLGADTMTGGLGNDTYVVDNIGDVVIEDANGGTDTIRTTLGIFSLSSLPNIEHLAFTGVGSFSGTGNAANNSITGGSGNDTLDGAGGSNTLVGGAGNDTYYVRSAGDVVSENGGGIDTIMLGYSGYTMAASVENLVYIGAGDATITGNTSSNAITGGSGNDLLSGGIGADTLIGLAGNDTYVVDSTGDVVTEQSGGGTDTVLASVNHTLGAFVENLTLTGTLSLNGTGNALDNLLIGNTGANALDGGLGNDTMIGGLGNDTYVIDSLGDVVTELPNGGNDTIRTTLASFSLGLLADVENLTFTGAGNFNGGGNGAANTIIGGSGNDTLDGAGGGDALRGGLGNDTYIVRSALDVITENGAAGTDTIQSYINTFLLGSNLENLSFVGSGAATLTGNTLANVISGGAGADSIDGGGGPDTIIGGIGADTITGGLGADVFRFDLVSHGGDLITDFTQGSDRIGISAAGFGGGLAAGTSLTASHFVSGESASSATAATSQFIYNSTSGQLWWDADGTGAESQTLVATLGSLTHPALSSGSFLLL